jgi:hypothetical protein
MSRFRGRWLDEEDDNEPPEHELRELPIFPLRMPPLEEPTDAPARGQWLDNEDAPNEAEVPHGTHREKIAAAPRWTGPAQGVAGLLYVLLGFIAILGDINVAKALVVAPVLAYITYSIAQRLAAADGQPAIVPILMGGLAVKFAGVLARYWIGLQVYGRSDATEYEKYGRLIAPGLRHFHLIDIGRLRGTNFVRLVTGVVFAITPASDMAGFLVFGFMAYVGMIFFWRAFKRAFPDAPHLVYLQILVLLPSLAFWPSAIGKDAWMVMGVGVASYGVANILTNRTFLGWAAFIGGVYAVLAVRPQVGVALLVGLVAAELLRSRGSQNAGRAGMSLVLLLVFGSVIMSTTAAFLGISSWSKASVTSELDSVSNRTGEGRSEFAPTPVNSPVQFPKAAFTVMFRPMPYEVHSPQELLSALENVALLGVVALSMRRLWKSFRNIRKQPYLLYCLGAIIAFVVEYSSFSNFALIARERTQVTALLLVFICMPIEKVAQVEGRKARARRPA